MKGGKKGRPRRAPTGGAPGKPGSGGGAKKGSAKGPWSSAPKKGERPKPFGGRSSSEA